MRKLKFVDMCLGMCILLLIVSSLANPGIGIAFAFIAIWFYGIPWIWNAVVDWKNR